MIRSALVLLFVSCVDSYSCVRGPWLSLSAEASSLFSLIILYPQNRYPSQNWTSQVTWLFGCAVILLKTQSMSKFSRVSTPLRRLCFCRWNPGRAPPRNTTVDLNSGNIDVPPNMTSWPSFHNGVAAGLKIAPASQVGPKLQWLYCFLIISHSWICCFIRVSSWN